MLVLEVSRVKEDNGGEALHLPLSAVDYINEKKGAGRAERLTGMLLLGNALLGQGIKDFTLQVLPSGKPVLKCTPFHFSISHSGGLCAVALCDSEIGIDLQETEAFDRIKDLDKFAERFLAPDEYECFCEEKTKERLCRLWTRKEALAKLLGRPLSSSLSSLSSFSRDDVIFETRHAVLHKEFFLTTAIKQKDISENN